MKFNLYVHTKSVSSREIRARNRLAFYPIEFDEPTLNNGYDSLIYGVDWAARTSRNGLDSWSV